jgi:hypothetical protein
MMQGDVWPAAGATGTDVGVHVLAGLRRQAAAAAPSDKDRYGAAAAAAAAIAAGADLGLDLHGELLL